MPRPIKLRRGRPQTATTQSSTRAECLICARTAAQSALERLASGAFYMADGSACRLAFCILEYVAADLSRS
jgi:hypothetical protein